MIIALKVLLGLIGSTLLLLSVYGLIHRKSIIKSVHLVRQWERSTGKVADSLTVAKIMDDNNVN